MSTKMFSVKYLCEFCGNDYSFKSGLYRHKKICTKKYTIETGEKRAIELKNQLQSGLIDKVEFEKCMIGVNLERGIRVENSTNDCDNCKKTLSSRYCLIRHKKNCTTSDDSCTNRKSKSNEIRCEDCSRKITDECNLLQHKRKSACTRLKEHTTFMDGTYVCNNCKTQYRSHKSAWQHVKNCNSLKLSKKFNNYCNVEGCNFKCNRLNQLTQHNNTFHSANIHSETKIFESMQSFYKWKSKEERKHFIFFKKLSSHHKVETDKKYHYFCCHFRKSTASKILRKTSRRRSSTIIDRRCTARIKVIETQEVITATYVNSHSHLLTFENIKYQFWSPDTRQRIKKMLILGYSPKEIRGSFKLYSSEVGKNIPLKEHFITTRQIIRFRSKLSSKDLRVSLSKDKNNELNTTEPVENEIKSSKFKKKLSIGLTYSNGGNNADIDSLSESPQAFNVTVVKGLRHLEDHTNQKSCCQKSESVMIKENGVGSGIYDSIDSRDPDDTLPHDRTNKVDLVPEIAFNDDMTMSCRKILKELDNLLINKKIKFYVPQIYDSLNQIVDKMRDVVKNSSAEIVKDHTTGASECVTTSVSEECEISTSPVKSLPENFRISQQSSSVFPLKSMPEKESNEHTQESETALNACVDSGKDGYGKVIEDNRQIDTPNKMLNRKVRIRNSNLFCDLEIDEDLNKPFLTVGPFEISRLELKSLDISIPDEEVALLKNNHDNLFEKGWLYDIIIDSYLYLLCQNKTNFEMIESWKVQLIAEGYMEGIKLSENQILIIPYNSDQHWILIVVHIANRKIYLFDSLNIEFIEEHLKIAKKVRVLLNTKLCLNEETPWLITSPDRCIQKDDFNCGVYLCYYAMKLMTGQSLTEDCNTEEFRKHIYSTLFEYGKVYGKVMKSKFLIKK